MHKACSEVGILYFGAFVSEGNALTNEYATTTNKHVIINKLQQKWGHEGIFASNFLLIRQIQSLNAKAVIRRNLSQNLSGAR